MSKKIAIIDDEPDILELVSLHLTKAGFEPVCFSEPKLFFDHYKNMVPPDLLVLDLMLPGMDGYDVCKTIRLSENLKSLYIIMLTARSDEFDRVLGLELGADDYVTKPFSTKELVARVKAALRRQGTPAVSETKKLRIKDMLEIDPERFEARLQGEPLVLTTTEFKLLELFAGHKGRLYTRQQILDHLWGNDKAVLDRTVDVHIKNLRDKIGPVAECIRNIRGMGYKLEE